MKKIKDVIIGVFAVIGFAAIVTGFTNEAVQEHTVQSHVWEFNNGAYTSQLILYKHVTCKHKTKVKTERNKLK